MWRWLIALCVIASTVTAGAGLSRADTDFENKRYAPALAEYEKYLESSENETRYRAWYRTVESQALLFRFGEAAERLYTFALPDDPQWRARFLLLRALLGREYLNQYRIGLPTDAEQGVSVPSRLTASQWQGRIDAAFFALYDLRETCLTMKLAGESYFLQTQGSDLEAVPTLWDFIVQEWTDYLLREKPAESDEKPRPESFLVERSATRVSRATPAVFLAAALWEQAAAEGGSERQLARELARLHRILLPMQYPTLVAAISDQNQWADQAVPVLLRALHDWSQARSRAGAGWQAAQILNATARYEEALDVCAQVAKLASVEKSACAALTFDIETPRLQPTLQPAAPDSGQGLSVRARNVDEVFVRVYPTSANELRGMSAPGYRQDLSFLRRLDPQTLSVFLKRSAPYQTSAKLPVSPRHSWVEAPIHLPPAPAGLYVVLVSNSSNFDSKEAVTKGGLLNITSLFLFGNSSRSGTSRDGTIVHLYALDARDGSPVEGAGVDAVSHVDWNKVIHQTGSTDSAGRFAITPPRSKTGTADVDPLVSAGSSQAFWPSALYSYSDFHQDIDIFVDTDRSIYRPGQLLQGKITVLTNGPHRRIFHGPQTVHLSAIDANGERFYRRELKLNSMGSAVFRLELPKDRLLGHYILTAEVEGKKGAGSASFAVEQYKRPTFEIVLERAAHPWKFGSPAQVMGHATYYFGSAVPAATISYRIFRESLNLEFCWWWGGRRPSPKKEIAHGEVHSSPTGEFTIDFTPKPEDPSDNDPLPARFLVETTARDASGLTVQAQKTFLAGRSAVLFAVTPATGFFSSLSAARIGVAAVDLERKAVSVRAQYALYRLSVPHPTDGAWTAPSLDALITKVADGDRVASGRFSTINGRHANLVLPPLAPGVYRLRLQGEDPFGGSFEQSVALVSVASYARADLDLPGVALADRASYQPGQQARLLIGSSDLQGGAIVEVWKGDELMRVDRVSPGVQIFHLPILSSYQGGVTVRWFGAHHFKVRSGDVHLDIPWQSRELKLKIVGPAKCLPGQRATWTLLARDARNRQVNGEVLFRVYDRALDGLTDAPPSWVDKLFSDSHSPGPGEWSWFTCVTTALKPPAQPPSFETPTSLPPPHLRLQGARANARAGLYTLSDAQFVAEAAAEELKQSTQKQGNGSAASNPRSDFAEVAVFAPRVALRHGRATVSARLPDSLTSWSILAQAITPDVKWGLARAQTTATKDLMVRLQLPRYLREFDHSSVLALIDNATNETISGTIKLAVTDHAKDVAASVGIPEQLKPFTVTSHGQGVLSWDLTAPNALTTLQISATAQGGRMEDREQRELPILPSRERLALSRIVSLEGDDEKDLDLGELPADAEPQSATLEFDPQVAEAILAALPGLIEGPLDHTEQIVDRYVPLALTRALFLKYPRLAKALQSRPARDTALPPWDAHDPRRLQRLLESPWLTVSTPRPTSFIELLSPATVSREEKEANSKLRAIQLPNGAFPWITGGNADPYLTLYVLSQFSIVARYGVAIPTPLIDRALEYLESIEPSLLKPEPSTVNLALFAAFAVTEFSDRISDRLRAHARDWIAYADDHSDAMTPLGKAYAAWVYRRLGDIEKSDQYLDRALDGAHSDPLIGISWAPEKESWLWYEDTVDKHAFFLRTLLECRPKDPMISGLAKWLLFNRKASQWKSSKSTASAIFSLLDLLKSRGDLDTAERFHWVWNGETGSLKLGPDFDALSPRWTREKELLKNGFAFAKVDKKGKGTAFASLTAVYASTNARPSPPGLLTLERRLFQRMRDGEKYRLKPLEDGAAVDVGSEIEVHLIVRANAGIEYLHLVSPRGAGFEPEQTASGWRWDGISRYEEPRDSIDQFFIPWLPHGEYTLSYRMRAVTPGTYRLGAATLQSLFSPDITANTGTARVLIMSEKSGE